MKTPQRITSPANPQIKQVVRFQRQASERRDAGRFCLEQARMLAAALEAGFEVLQVYQVTEQLDDADRRLIGRCGVEPTEVTEQVLAKIAYRKNPGAWVAVLRARSRTLEEAPSEWTGPLVVCAGLEKPGNLGAILRSADAAGVEAVFIDNPQPDLYNPNLVRASAGAVFGASVYPGEPETIARKLRSAGVPMVGLTPFGRDDYRQADLTAPRALVVGAEDRGLGGFWQQAVDATVRIPMAGSVDSLNVSVAAALVLFQMQPTHGRGGSNDYDGPGG
ncbi:MAG: RNA methyltransferase [Phycisphaeraceae bacterium]|nr:RNA methyltransferase [Phycisphaeraceae bacterium]